MSMEVESAVLSPNETCCVDPEAASESANMTEAAHHQLLQEDMLNHLANSKSAHFKSQQVGDPELDFEQKRKIAMEILTNSPSQFLSRFGHHLLLNHLDFFTKEEVKSEDYEVDFHLKQLRRYLCKEKNQVDVRNRRFEALRKLVGEGSYFGEKEMMKRNPLLYDQLIGQYLTPEEIENREKEDRAESQRSYVSHLLQQMEQHEMNLLRKQQQDIEDGAIEEVDTSDDDGDYEMEDEKYEEEEREDVEESEMEEKGAQKVQIKRKMLTEQEKLLLKDEFVTIMYCNFLEGRDVDFDYSKVDFNPEFDNITARTQDEEEKYFDSETPELVRTENGSSAGDEEEEDELDKFMKSLKPDPSPSELAVNISNL